MLVLTLALMLDVNKAIETNVFLSSINTNINARVDADVRFKQALTPALPNTRTQSFIVFNALHASPLQLTEFYPKNSNTCTTQPRSVLEHSTLCSIIFLNFKVPHVSNLSKCSCGTLVDGNRILLT